MLYLGVLVALGAGVVFGAIGVLTIWGGLGTLRTEIARDYLRTQAGGGARALTLLLVAVPLMIAAIFGLMAAVQLVMVGFAALG